MTCSTAQNLLPSIMCSACCRNLVQFLLSTITHILQIPSIVLPSWKVYSSSSHRPVYQLVLPVTLR